MLANQTDYLEEVDTLDDVDIDDDVDTELEVDTLTGKKSHYFQKFKDVQITCYDTSFSRTARKKQHLVYIVCGL